jgi:lipopolysaccharide biosynthesis glycosyltransferase
MDVRILHYTGKRRPWNLWSGTAFARLYRHVMTNDVYYAFMRQRWQRRLRRLIGRK